MKLISTLTCGLLAFIFISCSTPNDKFKGQWSPLADGFAPKGFVRWIFKIEKVDAKTSHLIFFRYDKHDTVKLTYDAPQDALVGYFRNANRKIVYLKDKDHLLVTVPNGTPGQLAIELERLNDSK